MKKIPELIAFLVIVLVSGIVGHNMTFGWGVLAGFLTLF